MMKEEYVITLENGGRYLLLHDLDEVEGKKYFYAVGVTPDYDLDFDDNLFFEVGESNGETFVEKVDPESEMYQKLLSIEIVDSTLENVPGALDEFKMMYNMRG